MVMEQGLAALLSSKAMRLTRSPALQSFDCMDSPVDTFMEPQYPDGQAPGRRGPKLVFHSAGLKPLTWVYPLVTPTGKLEAGRGEGTGFHVPHKVMAGPAAQSYEEHLYSLRLGPP